MFHVIMLHFSLRFIQLFQFNMVFCFLSKFLLKEMPKFKDKCPVKSGHHRMNQNIVRILWSHLIMLFTPFMPVVELPCGSAGKESASNVGDRGSILWLVGSLGEGKGYPLQYSGLENSTDCIVHGVT